MGFIRYITQDAAANKNNTKGKVLAFMFRLAAWLSKTKTKRLIFSPYLAFYRFFVEWVLGVELPYYTQIGKGLRIYHGQGTVVHKSVVIGENFTLRQNTTIGNAKEGGSTPVIGDNVELGSNVCVLGDIFIGDNVIIGAGSVVVKSVGSNAVVVGNPARVIKTLEPVN